MLKNRSPINNGLFVTHLLIFHARYVCIYVHMRVLMYVYVCSVYICVWYLVVELGAFVCGGQRSASPLSQPFSEYILRHFLSLNLEPLFQLDC